jgi:hypothetical protein
MNKLVLMIGLFLFVTVGCKEDGTEPDGGGNGTGWSAATKAKLYDKVWYSTDAGGGIDLEFLSNGVFRQAKSLEGTWTWKNDGDTMAAVDYTKKKFNIVFDAISTNQMTYRTDLGGNNFKTAYTYKDTK